VVYHKVTLKHLPSKTRRDENERSVLAKNGEQAVVCMLQGNLFFGTTDQLFTQLEADIRSCKYLLFDLRRVRSIDYTAVHLFEQIHSQLGERGGTLMFSDIPSVELAQHQFQKYLEELGLLKDGNGVIVWDTLDEGLEWMEEQILDDSGIVRIHEDHLLDLHNFSLFREFDDATLQSLESCMEKRSVAAGERVFSNGDVGDEVYLVRRGCVKLLMPLIAGKHHHLETISAGGLFGEIAFLDKGTRSMDAEAKEASDLYVLSRARFNERSHADPGIGVRVFARLAVAIASGIRERDAELRTLEAR
jgi:SulP family sulfate permease